MDKSKIKKPITDIKKLNQIKSWSNSDINKIIPKLREKKVHFDSTTRFLDACINFYTDEINYLLESGIDVNCADKDNLTAIHQACINSRIDLVDFLLKKNANINVCDKEGWTPLHIAADIGSYELAKYLIDHGARLDVANYDGDLPIMFVNETDYPDLKKYFQREMEKRKINLEECSSHERVIMLNDVRKWKANGQYDPPIDKINLSTPVHVAASKNYVEILSELLPLLNSNDINAQDVDGWTALHAAAHWGHRESCRLLINSGADLDIRTRANETILDVIDPELKSTFVEEIKKVQIEKEKMKTHEIKRETLIRNDNSNRRSKNVTRSSIARQSVEWKKSVQLKDPASERETLVKAGLNSDISGIITIEECDEKMLSPHNSFKGNKDNISNLKNEKMSSDISIILPRENNDTKTSVVNVESTCLEKGDIESNYRKNTKTAQIMADTKISLDQNPLRTSQLSNGNNSKTNIQEKQIVNSNNGTLKNEVGYESDSDTEDIMSTHEPIVQLRPKSIRDEIISHRNTVDRLSMVMAPCKSDEAEVMRREKARRVRSMRRSTQAIDLGGYKEVETKKALEMIPDINAEGTGHNNKNEACSTEIKPLNYNELSIVQTMIMEDSKIDKVSNQDETIDYAKNSNLSLVNIKKSDSNHIVRSGLDEFDSSKKPSNLKYQVSCPTHQNQSITHDLARLNISNNLKGLIKKASMDTSISSVPTTEISVKRGLNVNKCIESSDLNVKQNPINEASKTYVMKSQETQCSKKMESPLEKDCGSFVAKPVIGNKSKSFKLPDFQNQLSLSNENAENNDTSSPSESSDVNSTREENQISKSILTRMLNDQTTKQELVKEIASLKEEIKELKDKNKQTDSNLLATTDKRTNKTDEDNKISELVDDMSKMREENKKLKSQNEALLRVISRIQQELESFRKLPMN